MRKTEITFSLYDNMNPPPYIKYLSLTPHVENQQCIHVGDQVGLLRSEQTLSVLGTGATWC